MTTDQTWLRSSAIAIVGHRGSGKTALACSLLDSVKDRPVHVYRHEAPELLEERGWHQMYRLEQMYDIDNAVIWIDEGQVTIPKLDKRANDGLEKLLSIARHRDLTLVLSTCDSRWITRALEAHIDAWLVKDCEPRLLKNGSIIKRIIQRHVVCDVDEFRLKKPQYLFYGRDYEQEDGLHTFAMPEWFDVRWSKPYAIKRENCDGFGDDGATEVRLVG